MDCIKKDEIVCEYCLYYRAKEVNGYDEPVCPRCLEEHYKTRQSVYEHESKLKGQGYSGYPEQVPVEERSEIKVGDVIKIRGEWQLVI